MERVAKYFKQNPQAGSVWVTSDGYIFDLQRLAFSHAVTLEDQELRTFTNAQAAEISAGDGAASTAIEAVAPDITKLTEATKTIVAAVAAGVKAKLAANANEPAKAKPAKVTPVSKPASAPKKAAAKGKQEKAGTVAMPKVVTPAQLDRLATALQDQKDGGAEATESIPGEQSK